MALGLAVVLIIALAVFNYFSGKRLKTEEAKPQETAQEQPITEPTTHTVAQNDTLWTISEKYYKTGYNWADIQKVNDLKDADYIKEGQVLTIPIVTPIFPKGQVSSASTEKTEETKNYTVVRGDNLWKIAESQYGTGYKWTDIAKANRLVNPDIIHAGNVLVLP